VIQEFYTASQNNVGDV